MADEPLLAIPDAISPSESVIELAEEFLDAITTEEQKHEVQLLLHFDAKSGAYYITCHIRSKALASKADIDAVLDPEEGEEYKLNREIYEDTFAYQSMVSDAAAGRSFEDIVVEYDTTYRPNRPLKVYGGQHRVSAVKTSVAESVSVPHGIRVYFGLTTEQRFEIATVNNTAIAVPNDLLDRMGEELLGDELRVWAQKIELLEKGQNFADSRSSGGVPTVRIARTFVVNYLLGLEDNDLDEPSRPVVCTSGRGTDKHYDTARANIDWSDEGLFEAGVQFVKLHHTQRERVLSRTKDRYREYANKAMHPSVMAAWAYVAGALQENPSKLAKHYMLAGSATGQTDPLNAAVLVKARLKGTDPDTYRGLGSRIGPDELGRMAEVYILSATKAAQVGINLKLANAAIQSYVAKKARQTAAQAVGNL